MQNAIRLIVALGVSGACLYFATRGTNWAEVGTVLRGAHPGWVLAVVLVSLACHLIRAQRWRVLLRPVGNVPLYPAASATYIGFGTSMALPLRLGEFVRPALLSRNTGIPMSAAFSSVVLERLFDILLVISCFLVVGLTYDVPSYLRQGALVLGAGTAVGFVGIVLTLRHRATAERLIRRMLGVLPPRLGDLVWSIVEGLLHGLGGLSDVRTVVTVLAYSVVLWGAITVTYLLSFLAVDVPIPLVAGSLVTVVVVAAFVFLPQAPGFVGTWQAACVLALDLFGVPKDLAVGYSLLTWLIQMAVNIGAAAVFLAFEDVSLRQLTRAGETGSPAEG